MYEHTRDSTYREAAIQANRFVRRAVRVDGPAETFGGVKGSFPVNGDYGRFEYLSWGAKFMADSLMLEMDIRPFAEVQVGIHTMRPRIATSQTNDRNRAMELNAYRGSESERLRSADVVRMIERIAGDRALDVGARDGHFSRILAEQFASVTALDLQQPQINHPGIVCVSGDVTDLAFPNDSFDLVVCTEVLEHIPPHLLTDACLELERVTERYLLIGVPFKQDIRVGRTTCGMCGVANPPWGHVNLFDEQRLVSLFPRLKVQELSFVGVNGASTNRLSTLLMDLAGNPYGTYGQEEPCVVCGAPLTTPSRRTLFQKICTKAAYWARRVTEPMQNAHPNWIHYLFRKSGS